MHTPPHSQVKYKGKWILHWSFHGSLNNNNEPSNTLDSTSQSFLMLFRLSFTLHLSVFVAHRSPYSSVSHIEQTNLHMNFYKFFDTFSWPVNRCRAWTSGCLWTTKKKLVFGRFVHICKDLRIASSGRELECWIFQFNRSRVRVIPQSVYTASKLHRVSKKLGKKQRKYSKFTVSNIVEARCVLNEWQLIQKHFG